MVERNPATYKNDDESVVVRLDHKPGDLAMIAMRSPENCHMLAAFIYDDDSTSIIGGQDIDKSIEMAKGLLKMMRKLKEKLPPRG
jgi:hypothetical protein